MPAAAIEAAKEWHASEEGLSWHRKNYEKCSHLLHVVKKFVCAECGVEYDATDRGGNKYCSNNCMSSARRKSGKDDAEFVCKECGAVFVRNKYKKPTFCSRECSSRNISKRRGNE